MLFVEYLPHELEQTTYSKPVFGSIARDYSFIHGIDYFFNRVSGIAHEFDVPIAVADIANKPLYEAYHLATRYPTFVAGVIDVIKGIKDSDQRMLVLRGLVRIGYSLAQYYQENSGTGMFDPSKISIFDRYSFDLEDARRIFSARGIEQEAARRSTFDRPGTDKLGYIGSFAHTLRIKYHLLHPKDPIFMAKAQIYSLLPGLDRSIRIFEPSGDSWRKTANIPIAA